MGFSLNEASLIGNITSDITIKKTPSDMSVANFSVATNESYKNKQGEKVDTATFHSIVAWNKLAEIMESYAKKGSKVFVRGKITNRTWDDDNGNKRYKTEIVASEIILLNSKKENDDDQEELPVALKKKPILVEEEITIDEIPF